MRRPRGPWARPSERPPRLVLRFVVVTALGLAVAGAAMLVLVRRIYVEQAQSDALARARLVVDALLETGVQPADFAAPVSAERRLRLDELMRRRTAGTDLVGATFYGADGRATYSTTRGSVQRDIADDDLLRALSSANRAAQVTTRADGIRVLRTHVPIALGRPPVGGVVALDEDYAPIAAAARRASLLIGGVLEALLAVLLVVLVPMLGRVTSRIRRHGAELDHVATHDVLVDLPNRAGFQRAVERTLAEGASPAALLLVDLESFCEVNQLLGTERGDAVLAAVAERLRGALAGCESFARLGEDEFGVLLRPGTRDEIDATVERVRQALRHPFVVGGVRVAIDARAGAVLIPEHGRDVGSLLGRASIALTVAKEGDRGVAVYDPALGSGDVSRLGLTADLRDAFDAGRIVVHYQPQADLATRTVRGVEALVRWEHPERGLLSAAEFIGHAERGGLMESIRRLVLETAVEQWHEWHSLGVTLEMAVNLAAVDLLDVRLPDEIAALLERRRIPPEYLVLELTERTLIRDERRAAAVLGRLDAIGVRIAIDDFGTGYSSLAYIRNFPVHQVKLDRTFTVGLPGHVGNEAIVRSTVGLAHSIGATVVAEGVEAPQQWECLAGLGCDIAQGYLVGRPVPAGELTRIFTARPGMRPVVAA